MTICYPVYKKLSPVNSDKGGQKVSTITNNTLYKGIKL